MSDGLGIEAYRAWRQATFRAAKRELFWKRKINH